jgi:protein-L-isoaspartate(D-aspartate) O-methyltransferase
MPDAMPDSTPAPDYAAARDVMVDGLLRPNRVTDQRVLLAMRTLPRERFVPHALAPLAYIDGDLALGGGRVLMNPLVLARLVQLAAPRPGETALVVGAGAGYGATVLAACGAQVTALEENPALIELSARAGAAADAGIQFAAGRLADGWPERAPYDLIIIEGAVGAVPDRIGRQVARNGRLVTVLAAPGAGAAGGGIAGGGVAVLAEPSAGGLSIRPAFDANTPCLPELLPARGFSF